MFPYIGICDFPSSEQAEASAQLFDKLCPTTMSECKLMIGVMMSYKTMTGKESRWASAWPKNNEVSKIFVDHPRAFNTLHYADYDDSTRLDHLLEARQHGGRNLHALQLDMVWPNPGDLIIFRAIEPEINIVLQINSNALSEMDNDPQKVVDKLRNYKQSVDYVLLDKSHGKGLGMDAQSLLPFLRSIGKQLPSIGLAVAGGLGPDSMHLVEPIVKEFPAVSIDAQGRLRPSGNAMDPIDWVLADKYLASAIKMFS